MLCVNSWWCCFYALARNTGSCETLPIEDDNNQRVYWTGQRGLCLEIYWCRHIVYFCNYPTCACLSVITILIFRWNAGVITMKTDSTKTKHMNTNHFRVSKLKSTTCVLHKTNIHQARINASQKTRTRMLSLPYSTSVTMKREGRSIHVEIHMWASSEVCFHSALHDFAWTFHTYFQRRICRPDPFQQERSMFCLNTYIDPTCQHQYRS